MLQTVPNLSTGELLGSSKADLGTSSRFRTCPGGRGCTTRTHGSDTVQTQPKQVHALRSLKHKLGACCSFGNTTPLAQQRQRRVGPRSSSNSRSTAAPGGDSRSELQRRALRREQLEALLALHALARELVVRREARRVRALRGAAVGRLLLRAPGCAQFSQQKSVAAKARAAVGRLLLRAAACAQVLRQVQGALQQERGLPSGASFYVPLGALGSCSRRSAEGVLLLQKPAPAGLQALPYGWSDVGLRVNTVEGA